MMILRYIFGNFLFALSCVFPKSDRIWVFGAWKGQAFTDNTKWVYEYVLDNESKIIAVWLTHSPKVLRDLRNKGRKVYLINSLGGILYMLRAGFGFVSHGLTDLNRFACARIKIVETWHGIPMKPILLSDPKASAKRRFRIKKYLKYFFPFIGIGINYSKFFAIVGSSSNTNNILYKVFGKKANIISTGFPRLDGLMRTPVSEKLAHEKNAGLALGIYMPTYRREGEFDIISYFLKNVESINDFLNVSRQKLYVKIHPFDLKCSSINFSQLNSIDLFDDSIFNEDVYSLLGHFDYLITDYSSVLFDFFLLERDVFLLTPDRESYIGLNGEFVFDYKELGLPEFNNWQDLFRAIIEGVDPSLLTSLRNQFHTYKDSNNSKRLVDYVKRNIK